MTQPNPFIRDSMNASPRLDEVAASGLIREEDLRRTMEVGVCTRCGVEVLIMDGSDPVCAQCYLGVEHITKEGAEMILGAELEITRSEYEAGYEFFCHKPDGMHYTEDQFYAINAKMILGGYPVQVPDRHKEKQNKAIVRFARDQMLEALSGAPEELKSVIRELFERDDIVVDPKNKTIRIGESGSDGADLDNEIRTILQHLADDED